MTMAKLLGRISWRPSTTALVAGALILVGIILTSISWGFIFLVGLAMLGPGLIRELGWLKDEDEFQRQAARRAGYHAFIATGLLAFLLEGVLRSGGRGILNPVDLVDTLLAVLWFTWLLSSLLSYWGARRTARTVLFAFGIFWFVFAVADSLQSVTSFLMSSLVALPFFVLAWVAGRWPKAAGVLLLAAAAYFFRRFDLYRIFGPNPLGMGRGFVIVIFIGPLIASGIALLASRGAREEPKPAPAG
jgi:hypothetical protein